jgi:hypothetical protein
MSYALSDSDFTPIYTALDRIQIRNHEKIPMNESRDMLATYVYFLLDYGVNVTTLPYEILDERVDVFLSDPRITAFEINPSLPEEDLLKIYEKLKSNPVWMEKAILYAKDEPHTAEHFEFIRKEFPKYKERWPELKIIVPFCVNRQAGPGEDQLDFLSKYVDIVCPVSRSFGDDPDFPTYYERLMNLKENGKVIWSYTANLPGDPYANIQIEMKGLTNRVVFWQTYQHNAEGFLYWYEGMNPHITSVTVVSTQTEGENTEN